MNFEKLLQKLNPEQSKAVHHTEGPVIVIAGPGTGKTHMLSIRAGHIVQEGLADPHNILCLTFSEAGKVAMKDRLVQLYGAAGHRFHVYTFHGFCNKVIQENLHFMGMSDMQPATELQKLRITRKIVDSISNDSVLKPRGAPYFHEKHLRNLWHLMKSENWKIVDVSGASVNYIKSLHNREDFRYKRANKAKGIEVGDLKQSKYEAEVTKMAKLNEAATLFARYTEEMKKARLYDFDDMLRFVTNSFETRTNMRRRYQEQYTYFMVDEYQDTNGIQSKLIDQLTEFWDEPNLFVVGDDDQSVYEFQGARIQNIVDLSKRYQTTELITLKTNYRSTQNIIDTATNLVKRNQDRISSALGFEKLFTAHKKAKGDINVFKFPNLEHELSWLIERIQASENKKEIAIIYSKHKQADKLISILNALKIPYTTSKKLNILDSEVFRIFKDLLHIFHFAFLAKKYYYAWNYNYYPFTPDFGVDVNDKRQELIDKVTQNEAFIKLHKELSEDLASTTFQEFCQRMINKTGMYDWCKSDIRLFSALKTIMEFVINNTATNQDFDLMQFNSITEAMKDNYVNWSIEYITSDNEGVNLMTAHAAKGLEYDEVIMLDVTPTWEPGRNYMAKFSLPDTLTYTNANTSEEAARRAFYVAMTRARKTLSMTYSGEERSLFLDEAVDGLKIKESEPEVKDLDPAISEYYISNRTFDILGSDEVKRRAINFVWSFSALQDFDEDFDSFLEKNILKMPYLEEERLLYGIVVHDALHRHNMDMRRTEPRQFKGVDFLCELYSNSLDAMNHNFTKESFKRLKERGLKQLKFFFGNNDWSNINARTEQHIRNVEIDGVPIKGTLDKMKFLDDNLCDIVDWKTGKYKAANYKAGSGNHWKQGNFYLALLNSQEREAWYAKKVIFKYVEDQDGKYIEKEIKLDPTGTEFVKKWIRRSDSVLKEKFK